MTKRTEQLFRQLPAVSRCLATEEGRALQQTYGAGLATFTLRQTLSKAREKIRTGKASSAELEEILKSWNQECKRFGSSLGRRAINSSGILLHTGLGRAPLSKAAIDALSTFAGYSLLEVDLDSGERGKREERVEKILCELTGAEAVTVVNNNAAATSLVLRALAKNKEVIISRGQLIEIGGAFRMPDVMRESGCVLKEVGTTNRTHLSDYASAIGEQTGALMHVHCSNYRIHGFTSTPSILELNELGAKHNIPVLDDLGSGALVLLREFGLSDEQLVKDSLQAGTHLVCFSGDKLICGPQAGIICGKKEAVAAARRDPFFRMFRPDKLTLAALETTLLHFLNGDYREHIPLYQMLSITLSSLRERAARLQKALSSIGSIQTAIIDGSAYTGGGALPDEAIPSIALEVAGAGAHWASEQAEKLRLNIPSVFCRIHDEKILFDMRSLLADDLSELEQILSTVFSEHS